MSTTQLTATQQAILTHAIEHTDGRIDWFPDTVNGGARVKVLAGLANRRLAIHQDGAWRVTTGGLRGPGAPRARGPPTSDGRPDPEIVGGRRGRAEATVAPRAAPRAPRRRTRDNTKQATLIAHAAPPRGGDHRADVPAPWAGRPTPCAGRLRRGPQEEARAHPGVGEGPGADRVYRIPGEAA